MARADSKTHTRAGKCLPTAELKPSSRWPVLAVASLLAIATFVIYWPAQNYPFITWDDPLYVTANPIVQRGLTWSNIGWAFTTFHAANWHPLTWLSHMLDCSLFGHEAIQAAGRHRILNVALHAANAALLFALLRMATGSLWRSAAVAMFFAVHPLRVESVAWVSERKDVLSAFFGLLAMIAYAHWTVTRSLARYAAIVLFMALSLMAKPMLVTLPGILLLLDLWPLHRFDLSADARVIARRFIGLVLEKLPLIGLTIASCILTVLAQATWSAFATIEMVSWSERLGMAITGIARYVQLTLWPRDLALLYPQERFPIAQWLPATVLAALVTLIAIQQIRKRPWMLFGWLWFLGTLVPVIGVVKVGSQAIADRYTYVPAIGLVVMLVWAVSELLKFVIGLNSARRVGILGACVIAAALGLASREQLGYWRDARLLYERAIAVTGPNWIMHNVLGLLLMERRDLSGASDHLREAARQQPNEIDLLNNLAVLLLINPDVAKRDPRQALLLALRANELAPAPRVAFIDTLAATYAGVGMFEDAAVTAELAVRLALAQGQPDVAAQIAGKIPGYRAGKPSTRVYVEGNAPPATMPELPTTLPEG